MELYLDSANLDHIRKAHALGIISGVTTNPSLLAKEDPKIDVKRRILDIHKLVGGHLSVEVISTDTKGMLREAEEIIKWFPEATIKIPMIPTGLSAVRYLSDNGIPTNVTLIFTANQAIAAQNAGASYVSVFMGRLDDISLDSAKVLEEIGEIWERHNYDAAIISASIRNPLHITQSALAGAHIATVPYNVLMQSLYHPLTDAGVKKFLEDNAKLQDEIRRLKAQNDSYSNNRENYHNQAKYQNQNQQAQNQQGAKPNSNQNQNQAQNQASKVEQAKPVEVNKEVPVAPKQEAPKQEHKPLAKPVEAKPAETKAVETKTVVAKAEETKKETPQAEKPQAPKKQASSSTKKASTAKKETAQAEKTTPAKKESKAKTSSTKKKGEK